MKYLIFFIALNAYAKGREDKEVKIGAEIVNLYTGKVTNAKNSDSQADLDSWVMDNGSSFGLPARDVPYSDLTKEQQGFAVYTFEKVINTYEVVDEKTGAVTIVEEKATYAHMPQEYAVVIKKFEELKSDEYLQESVDVAAQYLKDTDHLFLTDSPLNEDDRIKYTAYRKYLRSIKGDIKSGKEQKKVLTYDEFILRKKNIKE